MSHFATDYYVIFAGNLKTNILHVKNAVYIHYKLKWECNITLLEKVIFWMFFTIVKIDVLGAVWTKAVLIGAL